MTVGVLYEYFRAPDAAEVRRRMAEDEPLRFDGFDLKSIDPTVLLGKLIGLAAGQQWSPGLIGEELVWPADEEQAQGHEGPWVTVLGDRARDVLAGITAGETPGLAERWAGAEEFYDNGDAEFLGEVIVELAALAGRAREQGESLYCWMSL